MLNYFEDLLSLVFPEICNACGKSLYKHENMLCNVCKVKLPYTNFHLEEDNPIEKVFWGRIPIEKAGAYLYFHKGNRVQQLMHRFKYKGKKEIGEYIGNLYGNELLKNNYLSDADLIIPVPLHPEKHKKRGYNQSEYFAKGLSNSLQIPFNKDILIRAIASSTQTKKNRFERWQNVSTIFKIENLENITNKHVILVDDVITTGATVEACANTLLKASPKKISFLALACTIK
ncbi:MAG TPA: ComF family protein [Bacteroidia bacterium]|nr:ComF family protein [Bacteroidia bacterium]